MSAPAESADERARLIVELEAALAMPLPDAARQAIEARVGELRTVPTPAPYTAATTQGAVNLSDHAEIDGIAVGVNLGTIIYGRNPEEDERRRLVWYLARLAARLARLPLRGLEEQLDQGDGLALPQVYVMLATQHQEALGSEGDIHFYVETDLYTPHQEYHPDWVLPDMAIVNVHYALPTQWAVMRSQLATEAVQQHPQLVFLGDPGSGKSTFVRYLAWALARRGLDQRDAAADLFGWNGHQCLLPIILPLRALAARLATQGVSDATVYAALRDEIHSCNIKQVDDLLSAALHHGGVLLLFDGLDEVPLEPIANVAVNRATTLQAVCSFTTMHHQARVVLTCRTRAFDKPLRNLLNWPVETIVPFTLGQIRHFVPAWYNELVAKGQLEQPQAERLAQKLLDAITTSPKLRAMAETPLLLTMMALVLTNKGELPRDRPLLYERILELLLGQWDKVREGQSLAETIGAPDWGSERIRPLLDRLSYNAHAAGSSIDGRGRLPRTAVRDALISFFEQARLPQPWEAARQCLEYFNRRSGLLVPDNAQDSYVFAHLTLQEHCAGRALVLDPDAARLVMQHRAADRWREPIFLGLGVVQQANPALLDQVLTDLIDPDEQGQPKPDERRQRDLILAAEIGKDRDWDYLRAQRVNVERLQRDLKRGLVSLLGDTAQPLPIAERVRAGLLLGELGDPRFPVTLQDWRREVERALTGDTSGYFCHVDTGTYTVGSTDDDPDTRDDEKPEHAVRLDMPLWIARYPITNEQWLTWVAEGGRDKSSFVDNAHFNHPNQPIVGVSWYICNDFCTWLSKELGVKVRLPMEEEWEAAARGGDARRYPWGEEWQSDRAATEEDRETRSWLWSMPVGCYPAGAALCGALDMAGNVWEWTTGMWQSYVGSKKSFIENDRRVLRGGYYKSNRERVSCSTRGKAAPAVDSDAFGFRVVIATR